MEARNSLVVFDKYEFKYKAQAEASLFDIDLEIKRGEKLVIVGPSGSGKSSLAKSLNKWSNPKYFSRGYDRQMYN